jgi:hypothetical protein
VSVARPAAIADEGAETLAKVLVAAGRERAVGEAVEGMLAMQDAGAAGSGAGELDGGLDRLGAGVAEYQLVEPGHVREQPLRQEAC